MTNLTTHLYPHSTTLTTPAVRLVVVSVLRLDDGTLHQHFLPVVAVRSRVLTVLRRQYEGEQPPQPVGTVDYLVACGWQPEPCEVLQDALIVDQDFGVVGHDEWTASNERRALAACPWPAEEDETRLAWLVAELAALLTEPDCVVEDEA